MAFAFTLPLAFARSFPMAFAAAFATACLALHPMPVLFQIKCKPNTAELLPLSNKVV
jgi:hypothetical protein